MKRIVCLILACMLFLTACGIKAEVLTWQEQFDLGVRYLSEGNYEEAILAFNAAIEIDPMQPESYISLAELYMEQDNADAALSVLEQGFAATEDERLRELLEKWKIELKMTEEAKDIFEWCYETMQAEDYESMAKLLTGGNEFEPIPVDFFWKHSEYRGICYDGNAYSTDLNGIGLKMIENSNLYYGELVKGEPNGKGVGVETTLCYTGETALALELYIGAWKDGKPNGAGVRYDAKGNGIGEQCVGIYKGNWINNLAEGEIIRQYYSEGVLEYEFHYACSQGKQVLDDRWEQSSWGIYTSSGNNGNSGRMSYQPDYVLKALQNLN